MLVFCFSALARLYLGCFHQNQGSLLSSLVIHSIMTHTSMYLWVFIVSLELPRSSLFDPMNNCIVFPLVAHKLNTVRICISTTTVGTQNHRVTPKHSSRFPS